MIGAANVDEAEFESSGDVLLDRERQPAPRVRRRPAPVPRLAPRAHGAAGRARGVPQAHPRVRDRRRHRDPLLGRASARPTTCRSCSPSTRRASARQARVDLTPTPRRRRSATRYASGCAPTCRGSTARACRPGSTTSPKRSRSAATWQAKLASGRWVGVGWPRGARRPRRAGRSSTTSSPRSSRAAARRSWSAASA